ncbi:MAG: flagellar basal body rod protein FlgB [Lachnospiraceae bacterium]|nr:flagellar basal body rod protein FlgB [Lachnospiraceae bacterium]MBR4175498.1 flagellar basal body rod protein FlgB [Lachnospiraceae bacterium]
MINSDVYNYINVLDKAADASALRNRIIGDNIANVDTPGYKRQDVSFEEDLQRALKNSRYTTLDDKVDSVRLDRINGTVYTDYANYSYRMDRNNVDIDNENVELASNQLKYNGIVQSVNSQFNHLKSAMGSGS